MRARLARFLDSPATPFLAAVVSLALGLLFTFVWAPHPWAWTGIDEYHDLAAGLARGEPFATVDRPWGYAYFVAAFYAVFGADPLPPILAQVALNAAIPVLLFRLVAPLGGRRVASLAAVVTGVASFNTVYASILASDALCTVLFLVAALVFARACRTGEWWAFAASGLIAGLVPQFRPNMLLLPLFAVAVYAWTGRGNARRVAHAVVFLVGAGAALTPWVARNYQLTGTFLPTSTRGGVQLWYGSLQVGPYLENRARNPRSAFEPAAFPYTSLTDTPLVVTLDVAGCPDLENAPLVYWTDRDAVPVRAESTSRQGATRTFTIPGQPAGTTVYYRVETDEPYHLVPPSVFFVAENHLGDLDRHDVLIDVFDVVRLVQHQAWEDPSADLSRLDLNADGRVDSDDLAFTVTHLLNHGAPLGGLDVTPGRATLYLADDSALTVPRDFSGRVTDLDVEPGMAARLVSSWTPLALARDPQPWLDTTDCLSPARARVNQVFYRREVHEMRRYVALARDNIGRDPLAFALAAAYRALRLFVIVGVDDPGASYTFSWGRLVYLAGTVVSGAVFVLFLAGVWLAWRRRWPLIYLALPVVYIPATIAMVLTNQRYTVTVQPLMFAFIAVALLALLRLAAEPTPDDASPVGRSSALLNPSTPLRVHPEHSRGMN